MTKNRPDADSLHTSTADIHKAAAPLGLPSVSVEDAFAASGRILEARLKRAPVLIRPFSSYLTASRGKGIRARSLILCAMNDEGLVNPDAASFAAAIELLHLATLVHDDVMDDAEYRRGEETLAKRSGARVAVITGDYLLADVLSMMAETAEAGDYSELAKPTLLTKYMMKIAMGELRQTLFNANFNIAISDYLRIIAGKTAALFEVSFLAGSILATKDKKERDLYRKIGRYIGMIFQLTDDCLDYESTLDDAGKNVESDYEQNVVTLPLIYAMEEDPALREAIEEKAIDAAKVGERVRRSDSIGRTRRVALKYQRKAEAAIRSLTCSDLKKDALIDVLHQSYRSF